MRACKTRAEASCSNQTASRRRRRLLVSYRPLATRASASYASRRPASAASGGLGYYLCLPRALRPQRAGARSRAKRPKFSQLHAAAYGARFNASDAAVARLRCARAWRSRFLHRYGSEGVDVTSRSYRVRLGARRMTEGSRGRGRRAERAPWSYHRRWTSRACVGSASLWVGPLHVSLGQKTGDSVRGAPAMHTCTHS